MKKLHETVRAADFEFRRRSVLEVMSTCGLVAMTSASHAEGRQFDPGQVYFHFPFLHAVLGKSISFMHAV